MKWCWVFLLLLTACGNNSQVPDTYIQPDEMRRLFIEIHLAEAIANTEVLPDLNPKYRQHRLMDSVLEKRGHERQTFLDSYEFYLSQPVLMDSLYKQVVDTLNKVLVELDAEPVP